jgi:uncharacterized protein (TIRG00374 family)
MKRHIKTALGVVITAALIYWLATSDAIDWGQAWQKIRDADPWLLLLSSATATAIFAIRAPRWRVILGDRARDVRFSSLWQGCVIGQMVTNILPRGPGEFARAYALTRREPAIPFSTGVASVVVDRVFDGIVVLLLLALSMPPDAAVEWGDASIPVAKLMATFLAPLVIGLAGLFALAVAPVWFLRLYHTVASRAIPRFEHAGAALLERFSEGLAAVRSPKRFLLVFAWTMLHWLVCALSFWIGFKAIGVDAPWPAALFTQGIIVLAVALPSTPGFAGVMEAAGVAALSVYGVDKTTSFAFIVAYHAVSYVPVTALGIVYFLRMGLTLGAVKHQAAEA